MSKRSLFILSVGLTMCVLLTNIYLNYRKRNFPHLNRVANNLYVTSQLTLDSVLFLGKNGIKTIVDIRPDGEADDQPSSSEIESASKRYALAFYYIPVPHESIPDDAVNALHEALVHGKQPSVLYCRSGRRAVRTFALVEAQRIDGPNANDILKMVHDAGFSADDLRDKINQRIASRNSPQSVKTNAP